MRKSYIAYLALILVVAVGVAADGSVTVETLANTTTSWNGATLPAYADGQPEVTILKITVEPGVQLDLHKHPVINAGVLLSGELTVITEKDQTLVLKPGDAIVEVVETWHYGKSTADEAAVIIVFYAGIENSPITVK